MNDYGTFGSICAETVPTGENRMSPFKHTIRALHKQLETATPEQAEAIHRKIYANQVGYLNRTAEPRAQEITRGWADRENGAA